MPDLFVFLGQNCYNSHGVDFWALQSLLNGGPIWLLQEMLCFVWLFCKHYFSQFLTTNFRTYEQTTAHFCHNTYKMFDMPILGNFWSELVDSSVVVITATVICFNHRWTSWDFFHKNVSVNFVMIDKVSISIFISLIDQLNLNWGKQHLYDLFI